MPGAEQPDDPEVAARRRRMRVIAEFSGLGFELLAAVLVGVYAGIWLDARLGTNPLFSATLPMAGFGLTMYSLVKLLDRLDGKDQ